MPIKLVAIDLDGTLLNSAGQIGAQTIEALRAARQTRDAAVVLASARPPRSVKLFYEQLGLATPTINYNGALVYDPPVGEVLLHRPLALPLARRVVATARHVFPDVLVSAECLDRWYTDRYDPSFATQTALAFAPDLIAPIDAWLDRPMTKLLLLGPKDRLDTVAAKLARRFVREIALVQTEGHLLQVMQANVSKSRALRMVADHLHVPRRQVLAIGDNANDVCMLQWAGVGVAMGNAAEATRAAADFITDHNDHDGVAKALQRFVLDDRP